jgi:hypothetical protein
VGAAQTVANNADFTFAVGRNVGTNLGFTAPGQNVTINKSGLYLIEWNVNLAPGNSQALIGLNENGAIGTASANSATAGNFSSGTILNISTVPYTLSLRNYSGSSVTLADVGSGVNSAASIRVLKFADGPTT